MSFALLNHLFEQKQCKDLQPTKVDFKIFAEDIP